MQSFQLKHRLDRIAIIGCGHVGSTSAFSLLQSGIAEEIMLFDQDSDLLAGEVMDLQHSVPLNHPTKIWAGEFDELELADIIVIAAGAGTKPGESRLELLNRNVSVIREIVRNISKTKFDGIYLMTTNPVDILAQVIQRESELPVSRVISSGTVLDTARLRMIIGEKLGIEARSVHAYIIGEHGDSEIATWSSATIAGKRLSDFAEEYDLDYSEILQTVRTAAPDIVKTKGYTAFAIASCVVRICEAILRNERSVLPVSTLTTGQYGISDIYLSLPCIVGRNGVERIIEVPLDDEETAGLKTSAEILKERFGANNLRNMDKLSHFDDQGKIKMVDVSEKQTSARRAVASGKVLLSNETIETLRNRTNPKGNPLEIARIAGIMGAKKTSELIPLCHQINFSKVEVKAEIKDYGIYLEAEAKTASQTGVEMEALTAVSVAALTIYDMCKAVQKDIEISEIQLIRKTGGKSDFEKTE